MSDSAENKIRVVSKLKSLGYTPSAITGIVANIDVETGGTFDYQQKQIKGPGYGLFQLDPSGPLPKAYEDFKKKTGKEDSAESQIEFMHETIYGDYQDVIGSGNAEKLRTTFESGDGYDSTKTFMELWERPGVPHFDRRIASAETLSQELGAAFKLPSYVDVPYEILRETATDRANLVGYEFADRDELMSGEKAIERQLGTVDSMGFDDFGITYDPIELPYAERPEIGGGYTVNQGDTLYSISQRIGVPVEEIARRNNIMNNMIFPNQRLLY
jgi:hypothetical protein